MKQLLGLGLGLGRRDGLAKQSTDASAVTRRRTGQEKDRALWTYFYDSFTLPRQSRQGQHLAQFTLLMSSCFESLFGERLRTDPIEGFAARPETWMRYMGM